MKNDETVGTCAVILETLKVSSDVRVTMVTDLISAIAKDDSLRLLDEECHYEC